MKAESQGTCDIPERDRYLAETIRKLRPCDDVFMNLIMGNAALTERFIRLVSRQKDMVISEVTTQKMVEILGYSYIVLDVLAKDSDGTEYNIEIQRNEEGADPRRVRQHIGILDVEYIKKLTEDRRADRAGEDDGKKHGSELKYKLLPRRWIIFIIEKDMFCAGKFVYNFNVVDIHDPDVRFDWDVNITYLVKDNADDTELGIFVSDMWKSDPKDMQDKELSRLVNYYRYGEGEDKVCDVVREYGEKCAEAAVTAAEENMLFHQTLENLRKGRSVGEIADFLGSTEERILEILKKHEDELMDVNMGKPV